MDAANKRVTQFDFSTLAKLSRDRAAPASPTNRTTPGKITHTGSPSKNKRALVSPPNGDLLSLHLVEADQAGVRASNYVRQKSESPWLTYEKLYTLRLGDDRSDCFAVATLMKAPYGVVSVRRFSGPDVGEKIDVIRTLKHPNIARALEVFQVQDTCYVVFEQMSISLYHCAGSPKIDEVRLAAIFAQIVAGLDYIERNGMRHGSLTSANVVLGRDGDVKLFDLEKCRHSSGCGDIKALGFIAMELMQGFASKTVGVQDLQRWPDNSKAVGFLSETTSARSARELLEHPLLQTAWEKGQLKAVFEVAVAEMGRLIAECRASAVSVSA